MVEIACKIYVRPTSRSGPLKTEHRSRIFSPLVGKFKTKPILSYLFCQGTDSRLNKVVFVLRGLIRHVQRSYDDAGSSVFVGANAVYALHAILPDILNDSTLPKTYLLVDALDECRIRLHQFLYIITDNSFTTRNV